MVSKYFFVYSILYPRYVPHKLKNKQSNTSYRKLSPKEISFNCTTGSHPGNCQFYLVQSGVFFVE